MIQSSFGTTSFSPKERRNPSMFLFGSFRPSERKELLKQSKLDPQVFQGALREYLDVWARADWLEEYNVERVGRWVGKNCSSELVSKIKKMAEQSKVANGSADKSINERTYEAFLEGLSDELGQRPIP